LAGKNFEKPRFIIFQVATILAALLAVSSCTVTSTQIRTDSLPADLPLSPGEIQLGAHLYAYLNKKYILSEDSQRVAQLERIVDHLSHAAGSGYTHWQVHLFEAPDIIDVRAVPGNRIFAWSGLFNEIQNEDELAGLLAHEIAHDLTRHTDPVRFTMFSKLMFQIGSIAGSTALIIASQGMVNLGNYDWMQLAYIEARDLGPEERDYSETEEWQAATIAMMVLQRSDCRPEALLEFYWRALEERPGQGNMTRLYRGLAPQQRLDILESLVADQKTEQMAEVEEPRMDAYDSKGMQHRMLHHPAFR